MTDPSLKLSSTDLHVEPGGHVSATITIANFSDIVEGFSLQVLGAEIGGWTSVTPDEVQIYPGQEATATLAFMPPAGNASTSGTFPFGIRAASVVDPSSVAVAEGDIEVGRVFGLNSAVVPATSSGRWRGRHLLTLTNWGNSAVTLKVAATDPDEKLAFLLLPDRLELPVGASGSTRVQVRTRRPFLRGTPTRLPFVVTAEPDPPDPRPVTALSIALNDRQTSVNAAFLQKPIISRFVVVAFTLLILALGGGLAYALTRPAGTADPTLASGTPHAPQLSGVAVDPTSVRLTWDSQPGIDHYQLISIEDGDRKSVAIPSIPGVSTVQDVKDLQPGTNPCYQLTAIRGEQLSLPSATVCVPVPTVPVSAVSSDSVAPSTDVEPSTAVAVTTSGVPVVVPGGSGSGTGVPGTTADTVEPTSEPSSPTTSAPTTSDNGGTTATFGPGDFLALVYVSPSGQPGSRQSAESARDAIRAKLAGTPFTVDVLDSADFPQLLVADRPVVTPGFLVSVGTFTSGAEVGTFCGSHPNLSTTGDCLVMQPVPAG